MAGSGSEATLSETQRHAISYVALALGVGVVVVTVAGQFGYLTALFGGDFVNVAAVGLFLAGCSLAAIGTAADVGDRVRALTGVVLCCVPVLMLAYFLAFTVD